MKSNSSPLKCLWVPCAGHAPLLFCKKQEQVRTAHAPESAVDDKHCDEAQKGIKANLSTAAVIMALGMLTTSQMANF